MVDVIVSEVRLVRELATLSFPTLLISTMFFVGRAEGDTCPCVGVGMYRVSGYCLCTGHKGTACVQGIRVSGYSSVVGGAEHTRETVDFEEAAPTVDIRHRLSANAVNGVGDMGNLWWSLRVVGIVVVVHVEDQSKVYVPKECLFSHSDRGDSRIGGLL